MGAFAVTFLVAFVLTALTPRPLHAAVLCLSWLIGAGFMAVDVSFLFLDHGGGTWLPQEAVRAKFYHPIITPFWILLGLAGTASMTRPARLRP